MPVFWRQRCYGSGRAFGGVLAETIGERLLRDQAALQVQRIRTVTSKRRAYIDLWYPEIEISGAPSGSSRSTKIDDADYQVALVRPRRVREKNLFPNAKNATGLIEWHMPLVPATIIKRDAVMRNRLSSLRRFSWHLNSSPFDRP